MNWGRMQGSQHEVGKKVGLDCSWLVIHGSSHTSGYGVPKVSEKAWPKIRVARRFGAALVLQDIMQEVRHRYLLTALSLRRLGRMCTFAQAQLDPLLPFRQL